MFKISTEDDYAIVLMTHLVKSYGSRPVSLKDISQANNLSFRYLAQIAQKLKKGGLLKSKEGTGGGYLLAKSPKKITLADIFGAISGPVAPTRCIYSPGECKAEGYCQMKPVWQNFEKEISKAISQKTLADITK